MGRVRDPSFLVLLLRRGRPRGAPRLLPASRGAATRTDGPRPARPPLADPRAVGPPHRLGYCDPCSGPPCADGSADPASALPGRRARRRGLARVAGKPAGDRASAGRPHRRHRGCPRPTPPAPRPRGPPHSPCLPPLPQGAQAAVKGPLAGFDSPFPARHGGEPPCAAARPVLPLPFGRLRILRPRGWRRGAETARARASTGWERGNLGRPAGGPAAGGAVVPGRSGTGRCAHPRLTTQRHRPHGVRARP